MPTIWTDENGTEWNARITIGIADKLRTERDIDLLDAEIISGLITDPYQLVNLLCAIHADQIEKNGITKDEFAELCFCSPETGVACTDALMDSLSDFSRRLQRPALAKAIEKTAKAMRETEQKGMTLVETKADQLLQREMRKALAEAEKKLD